MGFCLPKLECKNALRGSGSRWVDEVALVAAPLAKPQYESHGSE